MFTSTNLNTKLHAYDFFVLECKKIEYFFFFFCRFTYYYVYTYADCIIRVHFTAANSIWAKIQKLKSYCSCNGAPGAGVSFTRTGKNLKKCLAILLREKLFPCPAKSNKIVGVYCTLRIFFFFVKTRDSYIVKKKKNIYIYIYYTNLVVHIM